jgi:hypothetical protein
MQPTIIQSHMEETIVTPIPEYKLYKDRAIFVGTFLGGPLVAGYMAAENFKHIGQPDKVKNTWVIAIAATLVVLGAVFFIPGIEKIPNYIIPFIYTAIARQLVMRQQGNAIKAHVESGGQMYSVWRAVWIGLVGTLMLIALVVILMFVADRNIFLTPASTN